MGAILEGIGDFVGNIFGFNYDQAPTEMVTKNPALDLNQTKSKTFSPTEKDTRKRRLAAAKKGTTALRIPLKTSAPKAGLNTNKDSTGLSI